LARRLAYQVFSKLVELAPGGKYDALQGRAEPAPFRLARVTYPPPPRQTGKYESRCDTLQRRRSEPTDAAAPPPDDNVLPINDIECADSQADNTCLIFSRNLDTRVEEVVKSIVVERTASSGRREVVNVTPVAVRANSVCYANLAFGGKYRFNLRNTLRSADGGNGWTPTGKVAGPAGAFAAHDGTLYVAVHERGILASADNGATWSTVYVQT